MFIIFSTLIGSLIAQLEIRQPPAFRGDLLRR